MDCLDIMTTTFKCLNPGDLFIAGILKPNGASTGQTSIYIKTSNNSAVQLNPIEQEDIDNLETKSFKDDSTVIDVTKNFTIKFDINQNNFEYLSKNQNYVKNDIFPNPLESSLQSQSAHKAGRLFIDDTGLCIVVHNPDGINLRKVNLRSGFINSVTKSVTQSQHQEAVSCFFIEKWKLISV